MIKVKIFRNSTGKINGFKVTGHADMAPHGQDIVCAGVSALTQTVILGVAKHLRREVEYVVKSGNLILNLLSEPDELTDAIFETMLLGLVEIEKINSKNIKISEHGR